MKKRILGLEVEDVFEEFISSKSATGLTDKTIQTYRFHFNAIKLYLPKIVSLLDKKHIDETFHTMRQKELKPTTINSYSRTLKSFCSWLVSEGYTKYSPPLYKAAETMKSPYTLDEITKLLMQPKISECSFAEYRNYTIIAFLLNSGCRASTLCAIKICDIDLFHKYVIFRHNKNHKVQTVGLCDVIISILKKYLRIRKGNDNDYLFCTISDKQMNPNSLRLAINRYNESKGVRAAGVHLFRHSFAQQYLASGGNVNQLQSILGHSTPTMSLHYGRLFDEDLLKTHNSLSPLENIVKKTK